MSGRTRTTKAQDVAWMRLRNQRLIGTPLRSITEVVQRLGAMQAQELAVAKWSIAQRCHGLTEAQVDRAFADGVLLRTHVLRPTWHFVLPADIRWLLALTGPRVRAAMAYYDRQLGLDDAAFGRSNALIAGALAGGKQLTRKELAAALARAGVAAAGQRLGHLMLRAELDGLICSGALRGKQHTYALLDGRAPRAAAVPRDEALARLARRYFAGHGPATIKDFSWWSGLTLTDARKGVEAVARDLERLDADGFTFWMAGAPRARRPSPVAHLLQGYDEYIIAYSESRKVLNTAGVAAPALRDRMMFTHAIAVDGQVVGHWRRADHGKRAGVQATLNRPLRPAERRALDAELARYGKFVGLQARLAIVRGAR